MKKRSLVILAIAVALLLMQSGCSHKVMQPGDAIVSPVIPLNPEDKELKSSGSLNYLSNMSPLAQPSSDMVYTMLDKTSAPLSIFADNKYLYLLRGSEQSDRMEEMDSGTINRYGNVIEVYDVEHGNLVRKIGHEKTILCSAFTVKEYNLYAFDIKTGHISIFSSGGRFVASYDTGLTEVYVEKISIADNGSIILKIREEIGENRKIAIYNPDTGKISLYDAYQLSGSSSGGSCEISDFCLFDENTVLIGFSSGKLSLFNIEEAIIVESCVFPINVGFIEFEGNILYFTCDGFIHLNPGNTANFTNARPSRQIGRILINNGFNWPQTSQAFDEWLLNGLPMPVADENGRHYGMARNTKYLFFLDIVPANQEDAISVEPEFMVYRIAK